MVLARFKACASEPISCCSNSVTGEGSCDRTLLADIPCCADVRGLS
jgi:hypothetical protein